MQTRSVMAVGFGLILSIGCAYVRAETQLPKTFALAELKDLSPNEWGPEAKEGSIAFRAVLKGKTAKVFLPNWWGDGIHPPKGKIYILEVSYKDTVTSPVVAESFAGLGRYLSTSELHRFGGTGDGKWKMANVPVSWDLILLRKDKTAAEFTFRAPDDLPISRIEVREARLPEDQVRYEAESRAWVAAVQSSKAAGAKQECANEVPVIADAFKGKPVALFARPYYDKVYQNSAPSGNKEDSSIFIRMARNEYEPGAFGVYAQEDCDEVTYTLSDLTGPSGKLVCEKQLMTAEYAIEYGVWRPQRLWNMYPVNLKKGQSGWCFFNIHTLGADSKPGKYKGVVTVTAGGKKVELPISVEVLPITLLTMKEAGLRMGGCCTGYPSSGEMKTMLEHNHNMINIWYAGVRPEMKKVGDKVELDFYYMDEWMKQAKENGQDTMVWFLGGNPNGYPETMSIERDLYEVLYGSKKEYFEKMVKPENRGKILPEIAPAYAALIREIVAHAKEKGWPELILTPFDEPAKWSAPAPEPEKREYAIGCGPWIRDHFKAACKLIHEAAPGVKVYASIHHNMVRTVGNFTGRVGEVFLSDVDVFCTNAIDEDEELGNKVRGAGKDFWQYGAYAGRRYGFGFYFAAYDSRGSLCWAYNWGNRFDTTEGSNWEYAWYSPFSTIVTQDYEMYREGWDDRRYLETAKALAKEKGKDISELIATIRKETLADRGKGGQDKVNDFWEEGKTASKMDYWRKLLADKIMELSVE